MNSTACPFETALLARGGHALDVLSAFLSYEELCTVSCTSRAVFASRLRANAARVACVVLPPHCVAAACVVSSAANAPWRLTIAHTASLVAAHAAKSLWLARVEQLTLSSTRFALPHGLTYNPQDLAVLGEIVPQLQELRLSSIKNIEDITPLSRLEQLRRLDLSATTVRDLTPLQTLGWLEYLNVATTRVTTFEPLRGLPNLRTIVVDVGSLPCDVAKLVTWPKPPALRLKGEFNGHDDMIESRLLSVAFVVDEFSCNYLRSSSSRDPCARDGLLAAMQNVKSLTVCDRIVRDRLETFSTLTGLRELHFRTLQSSNISALASLEMLEKLSLTADVCLDLSPLASLARLQFLYCQGGDPDSMQHEIANVGDIPLRELRVLDASNHYLQRLTQLDKLEELSVYVWSGDSFMLRKGCARSLLALQLNGDVSLVAIHDHFPRLRSLEVQQCGSFRAQDLTLFTKLESLTLVHSTSDAVLPLEGMPQLQTLRLRGPTFKTLSRDMVKVIPNLRELDVEKTSVSDVSAVVELERLEVLNLRKTRVRDVTPLLRILSLRKVMLPRCAQCTSLVTAFHERSACRDLREVLHPELNCLWGPHWRQQQHKQKPEDPADSRETALLDSLAQWSLR